jgi:hypothetical protein
MKLKIRSIICVVLGTIFVCLAIITARYSDKIVFWSVIYKNGSTFVINGVHYEVAHSTYILDKDELLVSLVNNDFFIETVSVSEFSPNFFTHVTSNTTKTDNVMFKYCEIYVVDPDSNGMNFDVYWKIDENILLSGNGLRANVKLDKICEIVVPKI